MLYHAIQGNPMFAREILDRLEGKVKDAPAPLASMADAQDFADYEDPDDDEASPL